jgi:tetratricopeptide (TPR) repeat protein
MKRGDRRVARKSGVPAAEDPADAMHRMGRLALENGQHDLAVEWFARAIKQNPSADYLASLGTALRRQGRYDEASKAMDKAVQLRPDDAGLWADFGVLLEAMQRPADALLCFRHALQLDAKHLPAAFRSAVLLQQSGKVEEALLHFDLCERLRPNHARTIASRAVVLRDLGRHEDYLAEGRRAHALDPDDPAICNNVADALIQLDRFEEALEWLDRTIKLQLSLEMSITVLDNKAVVLKRLHRFDDAMAIYKHIRAVVPDNAKAEVDQADTDLLLGNFEDGWRAREARWRVPGLTGGFYRGSEPAWLGQEDIAGKTILLWSDEGLGDMIQFTRYAPMLAERGARVVLGAHQALCPLLSGLPGVSDCISTSSAMRSPIDFQCAITSLPRALQTTLDTIPPPIALSPPADLVSAWGRRLGAHDRLRVGLVWSGNPAHGNDRNRSVPLAMMASLLDVDACFISLQKDPRPADQALLKEKPEIIDPTCHLTDFTETAALIACLDLVITVDTSVAHLAGALACPTWILLPYTPDYRWLLDRDDSPWYPSVRLFRQSERRDYAEVLARVRDELRKLVAAFIPRS